jgi:magnesium transporter
MNFEHMPELKWHYGYYASLGLMAVVAGIMVYYFKRAKWL